jgi:hypothetical protein
MIEIRFDKTKDEVALLIWFLVDHSVYLVIYHFLGYVSQETNMKTILEQCFILFH